MGVPSECHPGAPLRLPLPGPPCALPLDPTLSLRCEPLSVPGWEPRWLISSQSCVRASSQLLGCVSVRMYTSRTQKKQLTAPLLPDGNKSVLLKFHCPVLGQGDTVIFCDCHVKWTEMSCSVTVALLTFVVHLFTGLLNDVGHPGPWCLSSAAPRAHSPSWVPGSGRGPSGPFLFVPSSLPKFLLFTPFCRYHLHTVRFSHFKGTSQCFWYIQSCNHHHSQFEDICVTTAGNSVFISSVPSSPAP